MLRASPNLNPLNEENMKNSDELKYQSDLLLLLRELQGNSELNDAEIAYNFFHEKHCGIVNKHFPMETLTRKQQELELKPWITKGILTPGGSLHIRILGRRSNQKMREKG